MADADDEQVDDAITSTGHIRRARRAAATDPEEGLKENLTLLLLEWQAALHREQGVPWGRLEVVRDELMAYLLSLPPDKDHRARLLPDRRSFERRLVALMGFFRGEFYRGGLLFALVPSYIAMLTARRLVNRDPARRTTKDILAVRPHVVRVLEDATRDPLLVEAVS